MEKRRFYCTINLMFRTFHERRNCEEASSLFLVQLLLFSKRNASKTKFLKNLNFCLIKCIIEVETKALTKKKEKDSHVISLRCVTSCYILEDTYFSFTSYRRQMYHSLFIKTDADACFNSYVLLRNNHTVTLSFNISNVFKGNINRMSLVKCILARTFNENRQIDFMLWNRFW